MNVIINLIIIGMLIIPPICIFILIKKSNQQLNSTNRIIEDFSNISEWSYQRYGKFYGNTILPDKSYEEKISIIADQILNKNETDIKTIAKYASCTYEECILKIRYLKNKRIIGDMYIDTNYGTITKCSAEDENLLNMYKPFIYNSHYQIDEIAKNLPGTTSNNIKDVEKKVYNDLLNLDSKSLLNGISINQVDKKIVYYTIEKHKKEDNFITINCPNCGALNDVNRNSKKRCEYCKSIIEYKQTKDRESA